MKATRTCKIDGCERPSRGHGMCAMHWKRWYKHGDPHKVIPAGRPLVEDVSYELAHQRVAKDRGPARRQPCSECGEPAAHWAYDHNDPDEQTDTDRGCTYSVKVEHYLPMCIPCHWVFDRHPMVSPRNAHGRVKSRAELRPEGDG